MFYYMYYIIYIIYQLCGFLYFVSYLHAYLNSFSSFSHFPLIFEIKDKKAYLYSECNFMFTILSAKYKIQL